MATRKKPAVFPQTQGEEFVRDTYRLLLDREPDPEGIEAHLEAMAHGVSRERLFFEVRVSPEGCRRSVPVLNLRLGEIRARDLLALKGVCFADGLYLALLGRTPDDAEAAAVLQALAQGSPRESLMGAVAESEEAKALGTVLTGLRRAQASGRAKLVLGRVPGLGGVLRRHEARAQSGRRAGGSRGGASQLQLDGLARRVGLLEQDNALEELRREVDQLRGEVQVLTLQLERRDSLADCAAFRAFADRERGSREDVLEQLAAYDGVIAQVRETNGKDLYAADLGCGRGEWLEKLTGLGISALGVDRDETALRLCGERGLETVRADLLTWLRACASASLDLVTLFRTAEYLPSGELAQALAECHRVLRPGGALIVETLNPESPDVAAGGFALDPTRVTPLPPALLEALVRGSGFAQTALLPEGTRGEKPRVYAAVAFREA